MDTKNVFTNSKPFLMFLKIFGLFPLTLNKKNLWKTTALDVVSTCIAILIFMCLGSISFMDIISYDVGSKILGQAWSVTYKLAIFLQFLLISYQLYKCREIASILTSIYNIDAKVLLVENRKKN